MLLMQNVGLFWFKKPMSIFFSWNLVPRRSGIYEFKLTCRGLSSKLFYSMPRQFEIGGNLSILLRDVIILDLFGERNVSNLSRTSAPPS